MDPLVIEHLNEVLVEGFMPIVLHRFEDKKKKDNSLLRLNFTIISFQIEDLNNPKSFSDVIELAYPLDKQSTVLINPSPMNDNVFPI